MLAPFCICTFSAVSKMTALDFFSPFPHFEDLCSFYHLVPICHHFPAPPFLPPFYSLFLPHLYHSKSLLAPGVLKQVPALELGKLPFTVHPMPAMHSATPQHTGATPLHGNNKPLAASSQHVHFHKAGRPLLWELTSLKVCLSSLAFFLCLKIP